MSPMVESVNLRKTFGPIHAVDDLSFSVGRGEVLGFLGPNGAGKSTTMRILTCFLAPDGGTARVCGHDIRNAPLAVRETLGYLPETAPAYSEMTVQGFLEFVGKVRGMGGAALQRAVEGVVEKCRLEGVRQQVFETLSKGYKRRTCLAQALIHDPPVLILDEPTDGLDPNQKHEVRRLITEMAGDKCIVLSTHILEEVDAVCTRAAIIDRGRLVADCTPEELRQKSARHGAVVLVPGGVAQEQAAESLNRLGSVSRVEACDWDGRAAVRVYPKTGQRAVGEVTRCAQENGWDIEELHVERGQLDEVFRTLTGNGGRSHD